MTDMAAKTDMELIEGCLAGDQSCFSELVARYKNLVYSIILRMTKDNEEANDLAQDVFLKIYKNLRSYSSEYRFSTWVIRIATNHVIDQHRRKKQETVPLDACEYELESTGTEASPEAVYLKREQTRRINKIVADLPEMYRIPIVLYHQQGLSYQEISDITAEPLSKVKNRIFRGRKLLKESYLKEGESYGL
ncbi:MAG: sigma-70 family RNA polymerase sigma factor [Clostridiales bacterium]|jgi:RNA polymerase sigma-70 factor (ECF subfamily)|nr:sigma-70 family RNA polymerase sigma factor [Clostridiales bacterium]